MRVLSLCVLLATLSPGCTQSNPSYTGEPPSGDDAAISSPDATNPRGDKASARELIPPVCSKPSDCDDHLTCTTDVCATGPKCEHTVKADTCLIDGVCRQTGDKSSADPCAVCNPAQSTRDWTTTSVTCYEDFDGDGFGNITVSKTACSCSQGWSTKSGDCNDDDSDVFPGQQKFFKAPYATATVFSFDYDCNNVEEQEYTTIGSCKNTGKSCVYTAGWYSNVPLCGEVGTFLVSCTRNDSGSCISGIMGRTQTCR